jgi:hypothetical protein
MCVANKVHAAGLHSDRINDSRCGSSDIGGDRFSILFEIFGSKQTIGGGSPFNGYRAIAATLSA